MWGEAKSIAGNGATSSFAPRIRKIGGAYHRCAMMSAVSRLRVTSVASAANVIHAVFHARIVSSCSTLMRGQRNAMDGPPRAFCARRQTLGTRAVDLSPRGDRRARLSVRAARADLGARAPD